MQKRKVFAMGLNENFKHAKADKRDEFYTRLEDVEAELAYYADAFVGKTVYCDCDDPFTSAFVTYFLDHFEELRLKCLLVSAYHTDALPGRMARVTRCPKELRDCWYLLIGNTYEFLDGDGDFRSKEAEALLAEADVVVTNPPFSLFRPYMARLLASEKQFLVVGNQNAVTFREVFDGIRSNRLWLGMTYPKVFQVPGEVSDRKNVVCQADGTYVARFGNICWFTNLDVPVRHETLSLHHSYTPEEYPMYLNLENCIHVRRLSETPKDWDGQMGVPITFLKYYNPDQFEILGLTRDMDLSGKTGMPEGFVRDYFAQGNHSGIRPGHPDVCYYDAKGRCQVPYRRIVIQKRSEFS